jgi:hypothetical protein
MTTLQFRLTQRIGSSCLSQDKVLSVRDFNSLENAERLIPFEMRVKDSRDVDTNKPYFALVRVENDCVNTLINFYQ